MGFKRSLVLAIGVCLLGFQEPNALYARLIELESLVAQMAETSTKDGKATYAALATWSAPFPSFQLKVPQNPYGPTLPKSRSSELPEISEEAARQLLDPLNRMVEFKTELYRISASIRALETDDSQKRLITLGELSERYLNLVTAVYQLYAKAAHRSGQPAAFDFARLKNLHVVLKRDASMQAVRDYNAFLVKVLGPQDARAHIQNSPLSIHRMRYSPGKIDEIEFGPTEFDKKNIEWSVLGQDEEAERILRDESYAIEKKMQSAREAFLNKGMLQVLSPETYGKYLQFMVLEEQLNNAWAYWRLGADANIGFDNTSRCAHGGFLSFRADREKGLLGSPYFLEMLEGDRKLVYQNQVVPQAQRVLQSFEIADEAAFGRILRQELCPQFANCASTTASPQDTPDNLFDTLLGADPKPTPSAVAPAAVAQAAEVPVAPTGYPSAEAWIADSVRKEFDWQIANRLGSAYTLTDVGVTDAEVTERILDSAYELRLYLATTAVLNYLNTFVDPKITAEQFFTKVDTVLRAGLAPRKEALLGSFRGPLQAIVKQRSSAVAMAAHKNQLLSEKIEQLLGVGRMLGPAARLKAEVEARRLDQSALLSAENLRAFETRGLARRVFPNNFDVLKLYIEERYSSASQKGNRSQNQSKTQDERGDYLSGELGELYGEFVKRVQEILSEIGDNGENSLVRAVRKAGTELLLEYPANYAQVVSDERMRRELREATRPQTDNLTQLSTQRKLEDKLKSISLPQLGKLSADQRGLLDRYLGYFSNDADLKREAAWKSKGGRDYQTREHERLMRPARESTLIQSRSASRLRTARLIEQKEFIANQKDPAQSIRALMAQEPYLLSPAQKKEILDYYTLKGFSPPAPGELMSEDEKRIRRFLGEPLLAPEQIELLREYLGVAPSKDPAYRARFFKEAFQPLPSNASAPKAASKQGSKQPALLEDPVESVMIASDAAVRRVRSNVSNFSALKRFNGKSLDGKTTPQELLNRFTQNGLRVDDFVFLGIYATSHRSYEKAKQNAVSSNAAAVSPAKVPHDARAAFAALMNMLGVMPGGKVDPSFVHIDSERGSYGWHNSDLLPTLRDKYEFAKYYLQAAAYRNPLLRLEYVDPRDEKAFRQEVDFANRLERANNAQSAAKVAQERVTAQKQLNAERGGDVDVYFSATLGTVKRPLIEHFGKFYYPNKNTLDEPLARQEIMRAISTGAKDLGAVVRRACAADPKKWENKGRWTDPAAYWEGDENFLELFRASASLRAFITSNGGPAALIDSMMSSKMKTPIEKIYQDILSPVLGVLFLALLFTTGTTFVLGALAGRVLEALSLLYTSTAYQLIVLKPLNAAFFSMLYAHAQLFYIEPVHQLSIQQEVTNARLGRDLEYSEWDDKRFSSIDRWMKKSREAYLKSLTGSAHDEVTIPFTDLRIPFPFARGHLFTTAFDAWGASFTVKQFFNWTGFRTQAIAKQWGFDGVRGVGKPPRGSNPTLSLEQHMAANGTIGGLMSKWREVMRGVNQWFPRYQNITRAQLDVKLAEQLTNAALSSARVTRPAGHPDILLSPRIFIKDLDRMRRYYAARKLSSRLSTGEILQYPWISRFWLRTRSAMKWAYWDLKHGRKAAGTPASATAEEVAALEKLAAKRDQYRPYAAVVESIEQKVNRIRAEINAGKEAAMEEILAEALAIDKLMQTRDGMAVLTRGGMTPMRHFIDRVLRIPGGAQILEEAAVSPSWWSRLFTPTETVMPGTTSAMPFSKYFKDTPRGSSLLSGRRAYENTLTPLADVFADYRYLQQNMRAFGDQPIDPWLPRQDGQSVLKLVKNEIHTDQTIMWTDEVFEGIVADGRYVHARAPLTQVATDLVTDRLRSLGVRSDSETARLIYLELAIYYKNMLRMDIPAGALSKESQLLKQQLDELFREHATLKDSQRFKDGWVRPTGNQNIRPDQVDDHLRFKD